MKPEVVLELLEAAAEKLKVRVSYEPLQTSVVHGGLCRVKGTTGSSSTSAPRRRSASPRSPPRLAQVMKQNGIASDDATLELPPKVREVLRMHEPGPGRTAGGRTAA